MRSLTCKLGSRTHYTLDARLNYTPGTIVNLDANAQEEYHFTYWSGSAVDANRVADPNSTLTTVVVDAHYTLVANFLRTRIYVDTRARGTNDGSNWENAFTSLRDALDMAQKGNKIGNQSDQYQGITNGCS